LLAVDAAKLKVVNLPTRVVQYWRHPLGGLFGLLQEIWETLISQVLMVLVDVENVNAKVPVSVLTAPKST